MDGTSLEVSDVSIGGFSAISDRAFEVSGSGGGELLALLGHEPFFPSTFLPVLRHYSNVRKEKGRLSIIRRMVARDEGKLEIGGKATKV